jgi:hypothetical protein
MELRIEQMNLPVIKIHETDFYMYSAGLLFQQVDNSLNQSFFTELKSQHDHSIPLFDTLTKTAFDDRSNESHLPPHVVAVKLPLVTDLVLPSLKSVVKDFRKSKVGKAAEQTLNVLTKQNNILRKR